VVVVSALRLVYFLASWWMTIVLAHAVGSGSTITRRYRGGSLVVRTLDLGLEADQQAHDRLRAKIAAMPKPRRWWRR
jgi:hypothetical protein